jgi:hypothetical protein
MAILGTILSAWPGVIASPHSLPDSPCIIMKISSIFVAVLLSLSVSARPQLYRRQKGFVLQNGEAAIALK